MSMLVLCDRFELLQLKSLKLVIEMSYERIIC